LTLAAELVEQQVVQLLPPAGALPVAQPPPAADRAATPTPRAVPMSVNPLVRDLVEA
jgi:hypothetical protein